MAVWRFLEWMINGPFGQAIRSKLAGRIGIGAFFGVFLGTFPLALLTGGDLIPAACISGGVGAVVGFFYHRGYRDAEKYWAEQQRLHQEFLDDVRRRQHQEEDDLKPPQREFGQLEVHPFDGPNGRLEPGDRVRVRLPRSEDALLRPDHMDGRYMGTQLVDGNRHLFLEIAATDKGSYGTIIPIEDADRLTTIAHDGE